MNFYKFLGFSPSNYTKLTFFDIVPKDLPDFLLGNNCRAPQFRSFHPSNLLFGLTYQPFRTFPTPYGCRHVVGLALLPFFNLTFRLVPPELASTILS